MTRKIYSYSNLSGATQASKKITVSFEGFGASATASVSAPKLPDFGAISFGSKGFGSAFVGFDGRKSFDVSAPSLPDFGNTFTASLPDFEDKFAPFLPDFGNNFVPSPDFGDTFTPSLANFGDLRQKLEDLKDKFFQQQPDTPDQPDVPNEHGPQEPAPADTLTGIVAASGGEFDNDASDFDILLNAVQAAGLAGALDDPDADLTVFAPNDAAFVSLAQTLGFEGSDEGAAFAYIVEALTLLSGGGDPIPLLTDILLYHVAPEALDSDAVLSANSIPTLLGETLGVDGLELVDKDPDIANPALIATDIAASNGIAHVIDGVLIPADILNGDGGSGTVDFIIGDGDVDKITTGANTDFVSGLGGNDAINLGAGDDVGLGGDGNDLLTGGRGNDILDGGAGDDRLVGGRDDDVLTGGDGVDTFRFHASEGSDVVTDFTQGEDKIQIIIDDMIEFADLKDRIADGDDGAVINVNDTEITLNGITADSLTESDFLFS